ncbi:MAG: MarR family transcriptional regulator [Actinobacteria bacterium]|jgi:DNA-binding MarR family transcriptional regulator|nr:MAG: MarR family transcriptional regulator [Actinomycetota bacterium]
MKKMNNANISESKEKQRDVFAEMVETVFLFIHEHYGEYGAILKGYDINYTQYVTLVTIYMNDVLSEGDLARMLFINPSTMSRMAYALEGKGWVKITRDKADRRKVMVELSPSGRRRMEEMRDKQAQVVALQVESLGEENRTYVQQVAEFVSKALRLLISAGSGGEKDI